VLLQFHPSYDEFALRREPKQLRDYQDYPKIAQQ
jgi:hypothetical protein